MLFLVGVDVLILGGILLPGLANARDRTAGFVIFALVLVATTVGTVWMWRRPDERDLTKRQLRREVKWLNYEFSAFNITKLVALASLILGVVGVEWARGALALLVVSFFFVGATAALGPMLVIFIRSLTRKPYYVRLAREEVDDWHREQGIDKAGRVRR